MKNPLVLRALATIAVALGLLVPLSRIEDLARERTARRDEVAQDVGRTGVQSQVLTGPLLVVPYRKITITTSVDPKTHKKVREGSTSEGVIELLPERLEVTSRVTSERRYRGIYAVPLLHSKGSVRGRFQIPERFGVRDEGLDRATNTEVRYEWLPARIVVGVSDPRGLASEPDLKWDGRKITFAAGTAGHGIKPGVHGTVGELPLEARAYEFHIDLELAATRSYHYVPLGRSTTVRMESDWPHPSFVGQMLPTERNISDQGFQAEWRTSHLATNVESALASCATNGCNELTETAFGVVFGEGVDVYLMSERATKYGFLFVGLTFVTFMLFEVLRRQPIHPVQYLLVGVGIAIFFLLLLALSEHVRFGIAYAVASWSCVWLLGFYVSHVLGSALRGLAFGAALGSLYGAMFLLLQSEDRALLLGSVLLFVVLAVIMVITRRVNWFEIARPSPPVV